MTANLTLNPAIDNAKLQAFEANFMLLDQQKTSKLMSTPSISYMPVKGVSYINRLGGTELIEVTGERNPDKRIESMSNDVRRSVTKRFTKTFIVDNMDAAINLITDPTSDLFSILGFAKERAGDRTIVEAARGSVIIGAPDTSGTSKTAAEDGVITVAGTTNFDYANVVSIIERNFANNEVEDGGLTLALSAQEEYKLKQDTKFLSNEYNNIKPVAGQAMNSVGSLNVVRFGGSVQGVKEYANPVLPEIGGVRYCLAMAPEAIKFGMELGALSVDKSALKVNSWEVTIDVYFKAVRTQGSRVQIITATV